MARTTNPRNLTAELRDAIIEGDFVPNQRLVEADLSAQFDASRGAIRAALFDLAGEGLVERIQNRGSRVRAITIEEAIEITEVRLTVEGLCASKAAERITDEQIREFQELRKEILNSVENGDIFGYSRLNQHLDQRIREIANQQTAVDVLERLRAKSVRHQFRLSLQPGRAVISAQEHAAIIDAVISRDPVKAESATRTHMRSLIAALHRETQAS